MPGGFDPALIEDEIPTAAAVHANLPAELMVLGKGVHQFPLGIKKLLALYQVVELAFNLTAQTELVDLEIAGIRGCTVPGVHCIVSKMVLKVRCHLFPGLKIHGLREFTHQAHRPSQGRPELPPDREQNAPDPA